jgi:hypothetical protein
METYQQRRLEQILQAAVHYRRQSQALWRSSKQSKLCNATLHYIIVDAPLNLNANPNQEPMGAHRGATIQTDVHMAHGTNYRVRCIAYIQLTLL